jgi:sarcosine oxidase delta subunit
LTLLLSRNLEKYKSARLKSLTVCSKTFKKSRFTATTAINPRKEKIAAVPATESQWKRYFFIALKKKTVLGRNKIKLKIPKASFRRFQAAKLSFCKYLLQKNNTKGDLKPIWIFK